MTFTRIALLVAASFGVGGLPPGAWASARCPFASLPSDSTALILYVGKTRTTTGAEGTTVVGPVRALALLRQGKLEPTDGAGIREGMLLWPLLRGTPSALALSNASSFLDVLGDDHCVYHADARPPQPAWTLLSTAPLSGVLHAPSQTDREFFRHHNDTCADQGDYEVQEKPPCTRPNLLAVSDVDSNKELEYWATAPYMWDTGIAIWRRTAEDGLALVLEVCAGCSD